MATELGIQPSMLRSWRGAVNGIEGFYNRQRLHSAIGYRSPADMEKIAAAA